MVNFSKRSEQLEIMDDLECSGHVVDKTLLEIDYINQVLGGNNATISGLKALLDQTDKIKHLKVADLGCGSGEMLKKISALLKSRKVRFKLLGIDANPHIVKYAAANCSTTKSIYLEVANVFDETFGQRKFDIVTATLFTHHFTNDELVFLLKTWVNQSKLGVVINDLHRHWFAYYSIKWLTSLFSRSEMVKYDAPLSVLRGFKKIELENLLKSAGIADFQIRWKWAFRWQVIVRKPS